jgi:hypothetical protein
LQMKRNVLQSREDFVIIHKTRDAALRDEILG